MTKYADDPKGRMEIGDLQEQIAALTAERDGLAAALIECYDAAIPQAMPWMGTDAEKSEYAAKVLVNHLRGLNRLSVYQSAERDRLRAALKAVEWGGRSYEGAPYCSQCGKLKEYGHALDCIVGLALKGRE